VSLAFVEKVLRQHRTTGTIAPKPHAGGQRPRLDEVTHGLLCQLVSGDPALTLHELCTRMATETGVRVSVPTRCRVLQRLGLPRKKSRSTRRSVTRSVSSKRGGTTGNRSRRSPVSA
jgi:transposase